MSSKESSEEDVEDSWVSWFCGLSGNGMLCEVERPFIEDAFNLYGIKLNFPNNYNKAISTILDREVEDGNSDEVARAAAVVYGLIHARFIITMNGLEVMRKKYLQKDFGECPRAYCSGQAVLPVGMSEEPKQGAVKLFCPRCRDLYNCTSREFKQLDGAFFGSTFCHLFFMTFEDLVPEYSLPLQNPQTTLATPHPSQYVPRVFGFRIHHTSKSLPKGLPPPPGRGSYSLPHSDRSISAAAGDSLANGQAHLHQGSSVAGMVSAQEAEAQQCLKKSRLN